MAIEKMKFVNISGVLSDFDMVLKEIAENREFHLEDANSIFSNVSQLKSFNNKNIYDNLYAKINDIYSSLGMAPKFDQQHVKEIDIDQFTSRLNCISDTIRAKSDYLEQLSMELTERREMQTELGYFIDLDVNMFHFFHLKNFKFRFGVMPTFNFNKIEIFMGDINAVVIPLEVGDKETHFMYFVSLFWEDEVDKFFKKMMFRRIRISTKVSGTPKNAKVKVEREIQHLELKISVFNKGIDNYKETMKNELELFYSTIKYYYEIYSIRKSVAKGERSFHLTGFIPSKLANLFSKRLCENGTAVFMTKEPAEIGNLSPPTKLKNIAIFKPFETLVNLFSLPSYNEIDPTPFLAIVYTLLFGIMFADVGQGFVLALGGFLMYRLKKVALGGVVAVVGLSSMVFGVLFGSVFGDEEIIKPLLMHPMKDATAINEILLTTVAIGFVLIILAMILNLINAIKTKRVEELFSNKGMAGLVFYFSGGLIAVISAINSAFVLSLSVTAIFLILPLILIYLKEPLTHLIENKKSKIEGGYFIESFFELFETLLSYTTNTMSFVRVGAFALNHVGMMSVVYTLAKGAGGVSELSIIVIGNIIVMGLEGLIVGIQVLRLMFYELFSKFFVGGGKPYMPFKTE